MDRFWVVTTGAVRVSAPLRWITIVGMVVVAMIGTTFHTSAASYVYDDPPLPAGHVAQRVAVDLPEQAHRDEGLDEARSEYGYDDASRPSRISARLSAAALAPQATGRVGATTVHGAERVAGAAATRGGVLAPSEIANVRSVGQVFTQADGATARVLQGADGRFNVVIDGERGLITTFRNLSQSSLDRLAKNYGWTRQ